MSVEIQIALLGILGTLGGTILGWILNSLSQKGNLNIYVSSWADNFTYNDTGEMVSSDSIEQTQYYDYSLSLDLYNNSGGIKIMRNIMIIFADENNILFSNTPLDDRTKRISSVRTLYDNISPINIPAKSVINIHLHNGMWNENDLLSFIWNTTCVYLTYSDEKNKEKKILIKKENYRNYFEHHNRSNNAY